MYARTNAGSAHGDFQDRNGGSYVTSAESFGHCSQLFWKKDPNDSGVSAAARLPARLRATEARLRALPRSRRKRRGGGAPPYKCVDFVWRRACPAAFGVNAALRAAATARIRATS